MPSDKSVFDRGMEGRIERAFEDAPAVIAVHRGPAHVFIFANRRFRETTDGRVIVGRTYADAFPEFVEQGYLGVFDEVYRTGKPFVAAAARADTPRSQGGPAEERYWNVTFQADTDDDGRIDGVTSFAFEVTEHVLARRQAEEAERRYDDLINTLEVLVWCVEPEGWRPLWVRGPVQPFLDVTESAVLETAAWWENIHPDDIDAVRLARGSLREPGDHYRVEFRHGSAGDARWLSESGQLRVDPRDNRLSVLGLTQDATERVTHQRERDRLQAQLLHVQKLESLGVLAGGIAHDFNNLLTSILGNASLAEVHLEGTHPASHAVGNMSVAARRASDLTRQLLAFSGRGHFRLEPVDLNTQLGELMVLLEATVPKKVSLRLAAWAALPPVEGDRSQLDQVMMNLVINGSEAIDERGGAVVVRTGVQRLLEADLVGPYAGATPGLFSFVEVSDTGAGMSADTLARIFDPFFTTKVSGRGLGLAAVQGIVRGHRGLIRVYSEPGRGTTFKVYLPASIQPASPVVPQPPPPTRRGTVLVVDDEPLVRQFVRAALEHGGYRVVEAEDGERGVETFRALADEINLILLDLTMPRMNGEDAFLLMRKIRATTPVVLSSGYNEVEATRRLVGRGLVDFIQKPYTVRELLALVGRLAP